MSSIETRSDAVSSNAREPRIAIVHEWLVGYAGSEAVVKELLSIYPNADLFAVVDFFSDEDRAKIFGKRAKTTFIQSLPFARKKYRSYLLLMPIAIEQFDLSAYDLIISSSHAVAKGVITGPDQIHVCICYTPIRYAWDLYSQYLREGNLEHGLRSLFARIGLHYMRLWDMRTANGVDHFIAISHFVKRRIKKVYRRNSTVIYPPIEIDRFPMRLDKQDFYLAASRMVPQKRLDLIVEAFAALPDRRLIVIGDGPQMPRVRNLAGPNVTILGYQSDSVLLDHLQRARAFIFASEEDQGFLPIEAQACGTPVIAFGKGGALETVIGLNDHNSGCATGIFFPHQTAQNISEAVRRFELVEAAFSADACRQNALRFNPQTFKTQVTEFMKVAMLEMNSSEAPFDKMSRPNPRQDTGPTAPKPT